MLGIIWRPLKAKFLTANVHQTMEVSAVAVGVGDLLFLDTSDEFERSVFRQLPQPHICTRLSGFRVYKSQAAVY